MSNKAERIRSEIDNDSVRPFWSVMIPTYNPDSYLIKAIESVIANNVSSADMQIEIVDDCSDSEDALKLIQKQFSTWLQIYRRPYRGGLGQCWNTCIERAKGRWIHILHQDDIVMPGFYRKLRAGIDQNPGLGAAFCRHITIDEDGDWTYIAPLQAKQPGIIPDWLDRIAARQLLPPPAIVVNREAYQKIGKYDCRLKYVIDWDIWKRIAVEYPVWYEPQVLAGYRVHGSSETSRLVKTAADINDVKLGIKLSRLYLPDHVYRQSAPIASDLFARLAIDTAREKIKSREYRTAIKQIFGALKLSRSIDVISSLSSLAVWSLLNIVKYSPRKLFGIK